MYSPITPSDIKMAQAPVIVPRTYSFSRIIAMPPAVLSLALKVIGRTNTNPGRIYDSSKLVQAGFRKPTTFERGLASFASWYRSRAAKGENAP